MMIIDDRYRYVIRIKNQDDFDKIRELLDYFFVDYDAYDSIVYLEEGDQNE